MSAIERPNAPEPVAAIDLSVVVPAFNEAERIAPTLRSIAEWFGRVPITGEIIVVDDGSTDATRDVVEALAIPILRLIGSTPNRGKGHAVKVGMLAARGRRRLFMDADNATPIDELPNLMVAVDPPHSRGADLAIGSRYTCGSRVHTEQPLYRRAWSRFANRVIRATLVPEIMDTQCGFKLFTAEAAEAIFSRTTTVGWGFDLEVLALAQRLGFSVAECGVAWSDDGRSQIQPLRDVVRISREFFAIRRASRRGDLDPE